MPVDFIGFYVCLLCRFFVALALTLCSICPPHLCTHFSLRPCFKKYCQAGFYNNQNTGPTSIAACLACATGTFQSATASTSCTNCAVGMFTDTTGQIQSKTCGAGKYQDQPGNTECKKVGELSKAMFCFSSFFSSIFFSSSY